jgi:predicted NBD/HSP70 family sugar kinase
MVLTGPNTEQVASPYRGTLLKLLRDQGPTSRTGLSEITGLSPTTISKAIAPLIDRGILRESVDETRSAIGRPALTLTPVPEATTVCGVQISVGTVRIGLADAAAHVRGVESFSFDPADDVESVLARTADKISEILAREDAAPCIGIGVAAPGPVDALKRRLRVSINLGWRDVPVSDFLEERLRIPVVVDHNVRAIALAEARYGNRGVDSLAYVYVRTGVGLGIAVRGEPFYGGLGGESYLGHNRVVEGGELCSCGAHGCLESVVSEPYLIRTLERISEPVPNDVARSGRILELLHRRAVGGDANAVDLEESLVTHLASALSNVVNLFTPDLVLVGGILSFAPDVFVSRMRERVRDRIFPLLREDLRLERADPNDDSIVQGAAAVALEMFHYA